MVYIDNGNKCHASNPDGIFQEVHHPFFEGKCQTLIEGYCYDPACKMITPFKPYDQLAAAQAQYEADLAEAAKAYQEGVDSVWT